MALELFIIQEPHEINFSGCQIPYSVALAPYTFTEQNQDIRIQFRIEIEDSLYTGVFREIKSQVVFPDQSGKISIDISSICDAYLSFYVPRPSLKKIISIKKQSARFRVVIVAQKDNILITDPVTSDPIMVCKGGIAYEQFSQIKFFTGHVATDKKPLHYFAPKELVAPDQKRFLSWINPLATSTDLQSIVFKVFNEDGSTITQTATYTGNAQKFGLYICPAGFTELKAMMPTDPYVLTVVKYSIKIMQGAATVVNEVFFHIDYRNSYYGKTLIYSNSVGGIDSIKLLGENESAGEYNSSNAQRVVQGIGILNGVLISQNVNEYNEEVEKFTGNTDFISKQRLENLRDLLLSRSTHEVKFNKFIPIVIIKKSVKFYNSKDDLLGMQFDWQHAYTNNFYTPEGAIEADLTCPAMDSLIVKQINRTSLQIIWALPQPYDLVDIEIDNGNPLEIINLQLQGNTGSQTVTFNNPAVYPATAPITIRGRVICDFDDYPESTGAYTVVNIVAFANSQPIANDDLYSIAAGFTTPQNFSTVLANDYDPDGDLLQVIGLFGPTTAGGFYNLSSDGTFQYTPPSALFNGTDSFTYQLYEVAPPNLTATATVRINVGNIGLGDGLYVKMIEKNHYETSSGNIFIARGDFYLSFFADPMCTIIKDVTGMGITVDVKTQNFRGLSPGGQAPSSYTLDSENTTSVAITGTEMLFYSGIYNTIVTLFAGVCTKKLFTILPGTGYVPV